MPTKALSQSPQQDIDLPVDEILQPDNFLDFDNPVLNRWIEQAKLKRRLFPSDCYHEVSFEQLGQLFFWITVSTPRIIFDLFKENAKIFKKLTNRKIQFEQITENRFRIHEIGFFLLFAEYLCSEYVTLFETTEELSS